ncbi:hypothetical protein [Bacillus infantis]|uniref:hypothetical protein n=1 Tax=Bacillus infantis TaxID=324767 RepID=UPI00209FCBE6|nr:hypothetical protein [Bacillus infantis]MCP1159440.1 hypothetical protein [Bacillus infantis]
MGINEKYIATLKNKVYKILPLFEESNSGLPQYLDSLIFEIYGLQYLVNEEEHHILISLICILEHFYDDCIQPDTDIPTIKREVFHCLDLIDKSSERW